MGHAEGRLQAGAGAGWSVHITRVVYSPGAGSCSFPVVFAAEGSQGAHLEPGNRATWE